MNDPNKNVNEFNKFLQNNKQFLQQKYILHFNSQSFTFTQLQTKPKIQIAIKFIYDVFSFQKYQKDQKMNLTLKKSLKENIINFIKKELTDGANNNNKLTPKFGQEQSVRLLKYCIQNNQMFAVHYDKKKDIKEQLINREEQKNNENDQIQKQNIQEKNQKQIYNNQPSPQNNEKIFTNEQQIIDKQKQNKNNQDIFHQQDFKNMNEILRENIAKQQKNKEQILKKEAKLVFNFYCKQNLNASGPNSSFQKMSHESNFMTLGKFIAFTNITGILYTTRVQAHKPKDHGVLDKKTINQFFRKISKSQKQINFDQFFELLIEFNKIDSTVYQKLNMGKDQNKNKILRNLKYMTTPFNMKGQYAKVTEKNIDEKPFVPILTGHSGKFPHQIKQDIIERRLKLRYLPLQPYPNQNQIKSQNVQLNQSIIRSSAKIKRTLIQDKINKNKFVNQIVNPERKSKTTIKQSGKIRLQNSRVSMEGINFLDNQILRQLIVPDEQNDQQFLKDYKIPKLTSNNLLRKKQNSHLMSRNGYQSERVDRLSGLKNRKNIVDQLKQRIKQVQTTQIKQQMSRQKVKRSIHAVFNKY